MDKTSKEQIRDWFYEAKSKGAAAMVVVTDTFDGTNFPAFVMNADRVESVTAHYTGSEMHSIREIYDISLGWDAQSTGLVWNLPKKSPEREALEQIAELMHPQSTLDALVVRRRFSSCDEQETAYVVKRTEKVRKILRSVGMDCPDAETYAEILEERGL